MSDVNFLNKKKRPVPLSETPSPTPETVDGLVNTDIQTSVVGTSVVVKKGSLILQHIILENVVEWEASGIVLKILSTDSLPLILSFINSSEALLGENKMTLAMNGGVV